MAEEENAVDKKMRRNSVVLALACLCAAFVLVGLCSQSSPLYPTNTWVDANCLLTVGRAMKNGSVLYRDIYEQKGPTLYLIHDLAAFISDSSFFGVFVLEVLSLAAVLCAGFKVIRRRMSGAAAFGAAVLVGAMIVTGGAFAQGDSAEEFCLPFLAGALCMACSAYGQRSAPMGAKKLFACGMMAGVVATIKYPALGLFIGLCAVEGVLALCEGGLPRALRSAGVFLAGMLLPIVLWIAYFAAHGALEAFYTAYIHNNIFLYSDEARTAMDVMRDMVNAVRENLLWVLAACGGMAVLVLDKKETAALKACVWAMAACSFAAVFLLGRTFRYYPLVLSVFAFAGVSSLGGLLPSVTRKTVHVVSACSCVFALGCALLLSPNAPVRGVKREELAQTRLAAYVQPGATLLQYSHLDDGLYLFTGTLPTQRYFCRLNVSDPVMQEELNRYLEEAVVDYVLVSWEELPPEFDRYQWIATDAGYDDLNQINKYLHLYRKK